MEINALSNFLGLYAYGGDRRVWVVECILTYGIAAVHFVWNYTILPQPTFMRRSTQKTTAHLEFIKAD